MVNYIMNNNLDTLFNNIKSSSLYNRYNEIGEILKKDENVQKLIDEINELQKEALILEYNGDIKYIEIDKKIEEKVAELNKNNVYKEYLNKMKEFNDSIK